MGLFRTLITLAALAAIAGIVFYFSPDSIKEKGLAYITGSPYVPGEVKKAAETFFATPELKRKKLLEELDDNLSGIQNLVEQTSENPAPIIQLVERTKEVVQEVIRQNNDPTIIKQITEIVTEKLIASENNCK